MAIDILVKTRYDSASGLSDLRKALKTIQTNEIVKIKVDFDTSKLSELSKQLNDIYGKAYGNLPIPTIPSSGNTPRPAPSGNTEQLAIQNKLYSELNKLISQEAGLQKQILTNDRMKNQSTVKELNTQLEINRAKQQQTKTTIKSSNLSNMQKEADIIKNVSKNQDSLNVATAKYNDIMGRSKESMNVFQKIGDAITHDIKKFSEFLISGTLVMGTLRQIQQGFSTVNQVNKSLTDIRIVTGQSKTDVESLGGSYNNLAKEIGATTQEVLSGATEWYRQGKSNIESQQMVTASIVESKLAAIDSAQATEYLTSVLNGYNMKSSQVMEVISKMVGIDNSAATSVAELSEALQRSSNSASQAGVSFDELLSYVGTVSSVTRKSAESIGKFCQYV